MRRSFKFHASNYAWAEVLATLAGLVSFPILTRLLSVADYGVMNLVASALGLTVALGKLGLQHAALRSHAEVRAGRAGYSAAAFDATVFWGMGATGLAVTALTMLVVFTLPAHWWGGPAVSMTLLLAAPLILVRVLDSALTNRLRAEEASASLAIYGTARRYAALAAVVAVLWWLRRDLTGFYLATLAIEALALMALMAWVHRAEPWPRPRQGDPRIYGALVAYGVPMLVSELSTVVLTMSDRFIIQSKLGADALGVYAASYNMCDYMRSALLGAMVAAAYPRCIRLWEDQGRAGLEPFLKRFMHAYAGVALFMVALMATVGGELMAVLASARYRQGGEVAAWVMGGMALQTVATVAAVGLYLAKRTRAVMVLVIAAAVASIAANVVLVPLYGIRGAGIAVLLVFGLLALAQMVLARRHAPVVWPWRGVLTFGGAAAFAWWIASAVRIDGVWLDLLARGAAVTAAYGAAALLLDAPTRAAAAGLVRRR
jgi:O-antigen/teichoic acid export membrane protein